MRSRDLLDSSKSKGIVVNTSQQHLNEVKAFVRQRSDVLSSYKGTAGIKAVGVDIASVHRIASLIDRYDRETLNLLFTPREVDLCQSANDPHQLYTVCFATKEAVGKALGTGLAGIGWNQIEANLAYREFSISLHGEARIQAERRGVRDWLMNWFHWDEHVLVHVLAQ
ncbi:MAG: 4'-phosphopantetheinyl transferase superfamily protein [Leptolyngbya sp. SIO1D8]|nr:4'-phosphopantetheinyl transferase superfamily protein [Leptolyngbya sp. SIO1D8]